MGERGIGSSDYTGNENSECGHDAVFEADAGNNRQIVLFSFEPVYAEGELKGAG